MKHRLFLACAAAVLMAGCATTSGNMNFADTTSPNGKLYGEYLVGSYADKVDNSEVRAIYYTRAFDRAPDDLNLGRRAVTSAFAAGDLREARSLAQRVLETDNTEPMSRAVLGGYAFGKGQSATAEGYFETTTIDLTVQILMNIMRGWNAADAGDAEKAKSIFANLGGGGYFALMGKLQTANLDAALGNMEAANEAYELVAASNLAPIETVLSKARALSAAGDLDAAKAELEEFSADNGNIKTGPVPAYIEKLSAGEPLNETLTPQQQTARALTESAYGFFLANRASDVSEIYLRFALMLDPKHDKAKLWLGSLIEQSGQSEEALALYGSIPESSSYLVSAKLSQANIYFSNEEDDRAIALLEKTNAEHTSFVTRESLGRARLIREDYVAALPIYEALVASMSEDDIKKDPEPLYFRGICYEREKQWEKAVADFKRVLEIEPENADVLNYLGYTWVDRGENLTEAFAMIRKAVRLEPESGAIVDSLGWAHYKLGQYSQARVQLEKAAELSPSSATIIDHLGDVYWKLGRFREAGYQWKRALDYDPTEEEEALIKAKLKNGLTAAPAP